MTPFRAAADIAEQTAPMLATGGWVVQLADAPLDLDNSAHLRALLRTYERFPEIGGRSPP